MRGCDSSGRRKSALRREPAGDLLGIAAQEVGGGGWNREKSRSEKRATARWTFGRGTCRDTASASAAGAEESCFRVTSASARAWKAAATEVDSAVNEPLGCSCWESHAR